MVVVIGGVKAGGGDGHDDDDCGCVGSGTAAICIKLWVSRTT